MLLLLLSLLAGACHIQTQLLHGGGLGVKLAHDLALVHYKDAVRKVHHLVQLQADQQHGLALVALGHDLAVNVLNGTHVQTTGGLHCHQQLGVAVDLAGDDCLLLVAAGHTAHGGHTALTAAHVVLLDQPVGVLAHLIGTDKAALLELRLPVALQHDVVFQTEIQHQTVLVAVFGDVAHAVLRALTDALAGDVLAVQCDLAARQFFEAGEAIDELGLVLDYSLENNMVLQRYWQPEFQKGGFIQSDKVREYSDKLIAQYDVRSGQGSSTIVRSMSGGNQQKAIIAREIDKDPKLLVAVQPTRGLDVGAIEYIHRQIVAERDKGKAVLLVSLELDEVMNLSDRILVMYEGEIVGEFDPKTTTVQELGLYMAGARKQGKESK